MESLQGKLMRNGQEFAADVRGRVEFDVKPTGQQTWSGFFALPSGTPVQMGESFDLLLADGRSHKIQISRLNMAGSGPISVSFTSAT